MRLTNKYNLPDAVLRAIRNDAYSKGNADFSVTELIDAPRVRVLRERHREEIVEDASDMVFSLLGRALHSIMEAGATGDAETPEERLYLNIDGYTVSGAMDLQEDAHGGVVISDHKVTTVYSFTSDKSEWHKQLNCYAEMVRATKDREVVGLQIIAFLRDWASRDRDKPGYPPAPIQVMNIPLWAPEDARKFLRDRVREHTAAHANAFADGDIPECSPEDRWQSGAMYAVIKPGNVRAKAIFKSETDAMNCRDNMARPEEYVIEHRPGEPKRCTGDWCKVSRWCDQWRRENSAA